ncbi:MAG: cytochrome c oxidase subunit II [Gammaproteobacteria bacterium]|nr:cytochrome c oxidase subunit II [Gammaproteobacteria bacterium]NNC96823.1 cytochrome c oxidase subunit II [Gammaproteobacteria bacterium]NNM12891.1 cytochrome c oxidase subunit II [Gammaproteobacteria bacterium]
MSKRISTIIYTIFACLGTSLFAEEAPSEWGLNMPVGVTEVSKEVYGLHMLIFVICCVIGVVVFGAMIWSIIHHRKSKGAVAAQFHHSTSLEIAWTAIPVLILFFMAYVATGPLITIEDTTDADITIKATGYQWNWGYEYLDEGFSFRSYLDEDSNAARQVGSGIDPRTVENYLLNVDNAMVVPVGKKVQMLLTGADVIHAWWVPELGGKKDAIPGFVNELWFRADEPGVYRGQCAELCGKDHGFMPIVVKAVSDDEYAAWVKQQKESASFEYKDYDMDTLMADGESSYNKVCASCHQMNGAGLPGAFPALLKDSLAVGDVNEHIDVIINGVEGTAMASFASLNDYEIAAIVTYERNAWGNDTGDLVQPADIRDRKAAK